MVIDDLHVFSAGFCPTKTHPPLIVDPDAVLAATITLEGFETVAGGNFKPSNRPAISLQMPELIPRHRGDVHESPDWITVRQCIGFGTAE